MRNWKKELKDAYNYVKPYCKTAIISGSIMYMAGFIGGMNSTTRLYLTEIPDYLEFLISKNSEE